MKSLKLLWMLSVVCMAFASCQQVLEPINTVPVVTTGEASYIKATSVVLHGEYQGAGHSSEYYRFFLLSTQKDFADVDPMYIDENEITIDGLQPNTTYYYAFGVAENYDFRNCQKVVGEIKSFTTSDRLNIASVTYTPWGEESSVDFVHETALGSFLFYGNTEGDLWQRNLMVSYDFNNARWTLPKLETFQDDAAIIAYWPYQQGANPYEFVVDNGTDYMYGTCEGLNSSKLTADIHLNHVMAKVKFDISLEGKNTIGGAINTVIVGNKNNPSNPSLRAEAIPGIGYLNMTTNRLSPVYTSHDGIWIKCSFKPSTDVHSVETFVVPTKFEADMAYVQLRFDNDYLLSWTFQDTSWESGYEYTYPLIITENGLMVGDVIVEEWHGNDEGTIIIKK